MKSINVPLRDIAAMIKKDLKHNVANDLAAAGGKLSRKSIKLQYHQDSFQRFYLISP